MRGKEEGGSVGVDLFCQLLNVHLLHGGNDLHHLNSEVKKFKRNFAGSRIVILSIPDPGFNNQQLKRWGKNCCSTFPKISQNVNYFIFELEKKKI